MESSIKVRDARPEDASTLTGFNVAMARETEKKKLAAPKVAAGVRGLFRRPEYGFYLVAETDGRVVGSLMVTPEWSDWRNGVFWWVQSVYVDPAFRRRGIYRALYSAVKARARSCLQVCGCRLYVERDNLAAQEIYRKLGMAETPYKLFEEIFGKTK